MRDDCGVNVLDFCLYRLESKPLLVSMLFAVFVKKREKIKKGEKVLAALWVVAGFFADCA